jgi:hypothetical protein
VGRLTEPAFDALAAAGCPACRGAKLIFRSYVEGTLPVLGGDPVGQMTWRYDGEAFVDGVFEVSCAACKQVVFAADVCPRCNVEGGLPRALAATNQWAIPAACPACKLEEVRISAYVPVRVAWEGKRVEKPRTTTELFDPGFHAFRVTCADCGPVVEHVGACPLCGGG